MTTFKKSAIALFIGLLLTMAIPTVLLYLKLPVGFVVLSAIVGSLFSLFWGLTFSCPRCGSPLLWETKNNFKVTRLLPKNACTQRGISTRHEYHLGTK